MKMYSIRQTEVLKTFFTFENIFSDRNFTQVESTCRSVRNMRTEAIKLWINIASHMVGPYSLLCLFKVVILCGGEFVFFWLDNGHSKWQRSRAYYPFKLHTLHMKTKIGINPSINHNGEKRVHLLCSQWWLGQNTKQLIQTCVCACVWFWAMWCAISRYNSFRWQ